MQNAVIVFMPVFFCVMLWVLELLINNSLNNADNRVGAGTDGVHTETRLSGDSHWFMIICACMHSLHCIAVRLLLQHMLQHCRRGEDVSQQHSRSAAQYVCSFPSPFVASGGAAPTVHFLSPPLGSRSQPVPELGRLPIIRHRALRLHLLQQLPGGWGGWLGTWHVTLEWQRQLAHSKDGRIRLPCCLPQAGAGWVRFDAVAPIPCPWMTTTCAGALLCQPQPQHLAGADASGPGQHNSAECHHGAVHRLALEAALILQRGQRAVLTVLHCREPWAPAKLVVPHRALQPTTPSAAMLPPSTWTGNNQTVAQNIASTLFIDPNITAENIARAQLTYNQSNITASALLQGEDDP